MPVILLALPLEAKAQALLPYTIVGDGIPVSLTGSPGDAARGRALVQDRASTYLLCHSGPFPESKFQGDLAPDLAGVAKGSAKASFGFAWSTPRISIPRR
jgi:sulfur-oxidizing protein SoxX